jgi:predicted Zn finger-like uncharacterized protein
MIVQCPSCQAKFRIGDDKVTDKGVKIRCTRCSNVFPVRREKGAPAGAAEAPAPASKTQPAAAAPPPPPLPKVAPPPPPPGPPGPVGGKAGGKTAAPKPAPSLQPPPPPPPPAPSKGAKAAPKLDLDFDLGFDVPDAKETLSEASGLDLDMGVETPPPAPPPPPAKKGAPARKGVDALPPPPPPPPAPVARDAADGLDIDLPDEEEPAGTAPPPPAKPPAKRAAPPPAPRAAAAATAPPDDFEDIGDLDLPGPADKAPPATAHEPERAPPRRAPAADHDPFAGLDLEDSGPRDGDAGRSGDPGREGASLPPPETPFDNASPPSPFDEGLAAAPPGGNGEGVAVLARIATTTREVALRADKPADAAGAPAAAPAPRKRPSLLGALINAVLIAVAVGGAVFLGGTQAVTPAGDSIVAAAIRTGLYATAAGRDVLYVRGRVENRSGEKVGPVQVVIEVLDGERAVARQEVAAGALPSPEEVYAIKNANDAEALARKLRDAARGKSVPPNGEMPFFGVFYDVPPHPESHRLKISAVRAQLDGDAPDAPAPEAPPAAPAPEGRGAGEKVPTAAANPVPANP